MENEMRHVEWKDRKSHLGGQDYCSGRLGSFKNGRQQNITTSINVVQNKKREKINDPKCPKP